jgi:hypothetical protein
MRSASKQDRREFAPKINKSPLDLPGTAEGKPGVIVNNEFDGNPEIGFRRSVLYDCLEITVYRQDSDA